MLLGEGGEAKKPGKCSTISKENERTSYVFLKRT
jgi:hypothetical protein